MFKKFCLCKSTAINSVYIYLISSSYYANLLMSLTSSFQEFTLRRGRVPAQKRRKIHRQELLDDLYSKVKLLISGKNHWLAVWGLVGCGKSQLVVDLLWEKPELILAQFKRIFWLSDNDFGLNKVLDLAIDALVLLSEFPSDEIDTISSSRALLGKKIHSKLKEFDCSSKILFVLDGIMDAETIRFFEEYRTNNCFFIATSPSREIFSVLEEPAFFHIGSDDLSQNGWMEFASLLNVTISSTSLNDLTKATGNNLALMEKALNLAQGNPEMITSLLHRVRYRPLNELSCTTSYHHSNIETAIGCCFKMISESLCNAFERCVVFEPLKPFDLLVLRRIWPMDLCGLETESEELGMLVQALKIFVWNSLLEQDIAGKNTDDNELLKMRMDRSIWLHPIIFSFLVHNRSNSYLKFQLKSYNSSGNSPCFDGTNINLFIGGLKRCVDACEPKGKENCEKGDFLIPANYYHENIDRLTQMKHWAELLCRKNCHEEEQRRPACQPKNECIRFAYLSTPFKFLKSLLNFPASLLLNIVNHLFLKENK